MSGYSRHAETQGLVRADPRTVFDFLDDQSNLSAHMSKSSGMMMGSRMDIHMEPDHTRRVGSRFGFTGSVLGIPLSVDEVVASREPPFRKTWKTTSEPQLWVIGEYAMGLELTPADHGSTLRVYIDYALPRSGPGRLLGLLFGRFYAKWCTSKMVSDAQKHFAPVGQPVTSTGT